MSSSETSEMLRYQCGWCGKKFGRLDHLDRHVRTHTQGKPYACEECGKHFSRVDIMRRHRDCHVKGGHGTKRKRMASPSRIRVSRACKACAVSKLRCTDEKPCTRCQQKNIVCEDAATAPEFSEANSARLVSVGVASVFDKHTLARDDPSLSDDTGVPTITEGQCNTQLIQKSSEAGENSNSDLQQVTNSVVATTESLPSTIASPTPKQASEPHFPSFLRDLLMPGDPRLECLATFEPDALHAHQISDFDMPVDHDSDSWTSSVFDILEDVLDAQRGPWASDSPVYVVDSQIPAQNQENAALAASAKAYRRSVWNWTPASKDCRTSYQNAQLNLSEADSSVLADKVQLPKHHTIDRESRDRIFSMLLASCDQANIPKLVTSFPSGAFLERTLWIFLHTHQQQWDDWIHLPTFNSCQMSPALLAPTLATGAVLIPIKAVRNFGFALQEILRSAIPALWEKDNRNTRDLQTLQGYALNLEVGTWSGDRRKMEIAESFHQVLVTILRRSGRLHRSAYEVIQPLECDVGSVLEDLWRQWLQQESWKRLVYHIFVQMVQQSMTRLSPPLISSLELSLPLPEPEELWQAETASEWKSAYLQIARQSQGKPTLSLSDIVRGLLDNTLPLSITADMKLNTLLLYGFWHHIFECVQSNLLFQRDLSSPGTGTLMLPARHQNLVRLLEDLKIASPHHFYGQAEHGSPKTCEQIEGDLIHEFLLMSLYVPLESIEILTGKCGDEEARQMYPTLQEWSHTRQARQGLWHASQLIAAAASLLPLQMRDFHAVAVYQASLTLWAYGIITGPAQWLQQQQKAQLQRQHTVAARRDGSFVQPPTLPQLTTRRSTIDSNTQNAVLYLTDPGESPELFRWLSRGVGNPAIRLPSPVSLNTQESTSSNLIDLRRRRMEPLDSESSESSTRIAFVQDPEAVLKLAAGMLLGRPIETGADTMDDKPPLVKNICTLMQEIGAAARAVI